MQLDPGLGVAVELRREEEDPREDADCGREVEGAPFGLAPEALDDEGDVGAEESDDHSQVILLQPPDGTTVYQVAISRLPVAKSKIVFIIRGLPYMMSAVGGSQKADEMNTIS